MKWLLCTLLCTIFVSTNAKAMQVEITLDQDYYTSTENLLVDLKYTNNYDHIIKIPNKLVPTDEFWNDIFILKVNGERARYIGKLYAYKPHGEPYKLKPGESISCIIDLSKLYDLRNGGHYSIHAHIFINWEEYYSNVVEVFIEGRDNVEKASIISIKGMLTSKCTTSEVRALKQAFPKAIKLAINAYAKIKKIDPMKPDKDKVYKKWFCDDKKKGKLFYVVRENWRVIEQAFNTKMVKFHCGCTNATAFVFPHKAYEIYVCKDFFDLQTSGKESQSAVIIHEMSHFYATAATKDFVYGRGPCRNLAKKRPELAVRNADNYMYFTSGK